MTERSQRDRSDNRVPGVLREAAAARPAGEALEFLEWNDWLDLQEHRRTDWIAVCRSWRTKDTDLHTQSAICVGPPTDADRILTRPDWDVDVDLGTPYISDVDGELHYEPNDRVEENALQFRPFAYPRYFHSYVPPVQELLQEFVLYHQAFWEANELKRIDDSGDIQVVARRRTEGENFVLECDADHLRDFLAAVGGCLVRYHDHRRWSTEDVTTRIGGKFRSTVVTRDDATFELWVRTDIPFDEWLSSSRLNGKDVVRPYATPSAYHYGGGAKTYESFVYGKADDGTAHEAICDPNQLSSYFADKGTPHFLTPVYFRQEVLGIYYAEPRRFQVSSDGISCLGLWSMPFDINAEGLVQVWLGDLAKLPSGHQTHWKRYNVPPRGTITEHRMRRDFLAQFADPKDDPVFDFHRAMERLIEHSAAQFGESLVLPLNEGDEYALRSIRLPLTDEDREFDELIGALAKVTADSLNVRLIVKQSGLAIDGQTIKGSIALLAEWLKQLSDAPTADAGVDGLNAVQSLRSTGAAHRKGDNFEKALLRLGLDGLPNRLRYRSVLVRVTESLKVVDRVLHIAVK